MAKATAGDKRKCERHRGIQGVKRADRDREREKFVSHGASPTSNLIA